VPRQRGCGTTLHNELLSELDPGFRARQNQVERRINDSISRGDATLMAGQLVTIPVVVHVVYRTPEENIGDDQVASQIEVLNLDFRAQNPDKSNVPPVWAGLVADANIEFQLASEDPDGNPTEGITRTETDRSGFDHTDNVKAADSGGIPPWPADRYLNIWVCNLSGGLLGYAQFPGGPPETDGVVILHTAFGTTGTANDPFHLGRTATHEVGHWLNLRHIWGDRNDCGGTDFVPDTPNAQLPNYGKPQFPHVSCNNDPNGDMFMNYMDYVDDESMYMFTPGQSIRMNATLVEARAGLAKTG
jgi:hypothetical protein